MARRPSARGVANAVLIALLSGVLVTQAIQAIATHEPADKVSVAAAGVDATPLLQLSTGVDVSAESTINLMDTTMKVSSPTDLALNLTAECALWTNTATDPQDDNTTTGGGADQQETLARVEVFLSLDDTIVPVAEGEAAGVETNDPDVVAELGRVVFCNRAIRQSQEGFDDENGDQGDGDEDEIIRLFNRTRSANAFNWIAQDVGVDCPETPDPNVLCYDKVGDGTNGNNIIHVEAFARLSVEIDCSQGTQNDPVAACPALVTDDGIGNPAARAAVGKRSLVINPTKLINDEDVNATDPPPEPAP